MPEIRGCLVDEKRPPELAMNCRALEILFAHRIELGSRQRRKGCRKTPSLLQARSERADIGQLRSTFDSAMARQDLLQECRTGAGLTDNEDRVRRLAAATNASI